MYITTRVLFITTFVTLLQITLQDVTNYDDQSSCFCQLRGELDDCSCKVESIDSFNNLKIWPRLNSLLETPYFRYYKVNIFRKCPFASESVGKCGSRSCAVDECKEDQIPSGLKKNHSHSKNKYTKQAQREGSCDEEQNELGDLDTHLSDESKEAFKDWKRYDDAQENFCEIEDEDSPDAVYYDLIRNPERFTGYAGPSAVNVWKLIYDQNCFKPDQADVPNYLSTQQEMREDESDKLIDAYINLFKKSKGLCLEKRVFYRMISGFHTSINVDVTANWLLPANNGWSGNTWGPNVEEFKKRFDPELTWGEGPQRLKNLYFFYLVELRALAKALPYLEQEDYYTGNEKEDAEVREGVKEILEVIKSFPEHFDENKLFQGDRKKLKEDFKVHFRNISRIMDCVGCDKCRLWGKLQMTGMGTALKILFSGDSMGLGSTVTQEHKKADIPFQLTRLEIVALLNGFGRISKSIHELEHFRKLMS